MVKKSTKSKSKRSTIRHKHKVLKKVKQHHKKQRREAKKASKKGTQKNVFKDPGIPSQWPYRDEVVQQMKFEQQRIQQQEQQKKEQKKRKRDEENTMANNVHSMEKLKLSVLQSQTQYENIAKRQKQIVDDQQTQKVQQDATRRAYYRDFKRVIELSDVIIQVLDIRDPMSYRNQKVEEYIKKNYTEKKQILLLNKVDLVPKQNAEKWVSYYRKQLPTIAFKCSTQKQSSNLKFGSHKIKSNHLNSKSKGTEQGDVWEKVSGGDSIGAEELLQLLKNFSRNQNIKTTISVGIIGFPNVGKSSLINSLVRNKATQVGNLPGVTKSIQEIHLDKNIRLIDSPGVIFDNLLISNDPLASTNQTNLQNDLNRNIANGNSSQMNSIQAEISIIDQDNEQNKINSRPVQISTQRRRIDQIEDPQDFVDQILDLVGKKKLQSIYLLGDFIDGMDFLTQLAQKRGKLKKSGIVDINAIFKIIQKDWNDGKIPYFTEPPQEDIQLSPDQIDQNKIILTNEILK